MKKNNKGFSLVELIIVIAIMAILVGVMTPQLIKYLAKAKVAADKAFLDTVYTALVTATNDPDVVLDSDSVDIVADFVNPTRLDEIPNDSLVYKELCDTLGWPDLNQSTYISYLKSKHGANAQIWFQYDGQCKNPVFMWITETDRTGAGKISDTGTTAENLEHRRVIAIY